MYDFMSYGLRQITISFIESNINIINVGGYDFTKVIYFT